MKVGFSSMNTPEDLAPDEFARALKAAGTPRSGSASTPTSPPRGRPRTRPAARCRPVPPDDGPVRQPHDGGRRHRAAAARTSASACPSSTTCSTSRRSVATLDLVSGGRVLFGVGVGWNEEELADHRPDIPGPSRYRALAECVAALRSLWCDEESAFHGEFFDFDDGVGVPEAAPATAPARALGTGGKLGTQHAAAWADEWAPMDVALGDVAEAASGRFREATAAAGRGDMPVTIVTFGDPTPDTLHHYRDLGIDRVVIGAAAHGWDDPSTTYPFIDRYASLVPELAT